MIRTRGKPAEKSGYLHHVVQLMIRTEGWTKDSEARLVGRSASCS